MRRLLALLPLVLAMACGRGPAKSADGITFWYWNTRYELSPSQTKELKELGVQELFVRAGTFSNDGEGLVPILPQHWVRGSASFPIHLVYNMDSGALRHFEEFTVEAMSKAVWDRYRLDSELARETGHVVRGLQLDFDVPTRLLPKYEKLLGSLRKSIGRRQKLSITSLPTWFGSNDFGGVVSQLDFYMPQFYDTSVPKTLSELKAISDKASLRRGIDQAERLGKPFYAGVSSFGRALLYDPDEKLQGAYQGMSPDQAMRHPSLVLEAEMETAEERLLRFRAVTAGANGKGKGWYLVFRIPKPASVAEDLALVRGSKGGVCQGAALFRVPEPEESMALPLSAIIAQVQGKSATPDLKVSAKVELNPWSRIEKQAPDDRVSVTLWFENQGTEPLQTGENALSARVTWPGGAVAELQKGGFDQATPSRSGLRSSLAVSDEMVAKRWSMRAGERVSLGPILLKPGTLLNCEWSARTLSGSMAGGSYRFDWNDKDVQKENDPRRVGGG